MNFPLLRLDFNETRTSVALGNAKCHKSPSNGPEVSTPEQT